MSPAAPRPAHVPVLLPEVVAAPDPQGPGLAIDGTFGAGGYTRALLERDPALRVIAIDRDASAIEGGGELAAASGGRLRLVQGRFGALDTIVGAHGEEAADWIVLDIGVSSMQLDRAERGFSFRHDGPLDMRMGADGASAADLVNEADEAHLADILFHFGEERRARAVARAIIEARRKARIESTAQLADLVAGVVRVDPASHIHAATRTFQGLRIAVNDELGELAAALHAAERVLKPGGRLAIVTFHSLEDRIVKQFFAARSGRVVQASRHLPGAAAPAAKTFAPVTKGPVLPSPEEAAANPRARSAKLRAAQRTTAPAGEPLAPMIRLINILAVIGLVWSAGYAYSIKYDTLYQAGQVSKLKSQLHAERQAIAVLRAEWQLLTRPDRLQGAVARNLQLEPIGTDHLARLSDLPDRPDRGDEIGRLLAATATPKDRSASAASEPHTTGSIPRSTTTRTVRTRTPITASR